MLLIFSNLIQMQHYSDSNLKVNLQKNNILEFTWKIKMK